MTAVALTHRTARFRAARFRTVRALWLEIKHSAVVWVLPVLAALFYVNAYRKAAGYPPIWTVRASALGEANVIFFSVIAAGIAAWAATRESRRKTGDLLATTARAPWARQATVLAATAFWNVLAYLAGVAVVYVQTALQATWGGPPLWPVAAGAATVAASCAVGFTIGTLLPGRFTAPVVAVVVFVAWFIGVEASNSVNMFSNVTDGKGTAALFVATDGGRPRHVDAGVYYHVPPDIPIAQVMFMGGVLLVMAGLLALLPAARVPGVRGVSFAGRQWLTAAAAVGVACGVAASATAFALTGTARYSLTAGGWEIPALHDAAGDQPVPYTPDCTGSAFTVCIHPAFAPYLGAMSAALQPAAAEIAGLPGAPVRAEMTTDDAPPAVASVYEYSPEHEGFSGASFWTPPASVRTAEWEQAKQQDFITWFVSGPAEPESGKPADQESGNPTPAQEAVAIALLAKIGAPVPEYPQFSQPGTQPGGSSASSTAGGSGTPSAASAAQITAAATRLESLPPAARRAWLAANIAALRSGTITLARIP